MDGTTVVKLADTRSLCAVSRAYTTRERLRRKPPLGAHSQPASSVEPVEPAVVFGVTVDRLDGFLSFSVEHAHAGRVAKNSDPSPRTIETRSSQPIFSSRRA
jgi:hypothetical protein